MNKTTYIMILILTFCITTTFTSSISAQSSMSKKSNTSAESSILVKEGAAYRLALNGHKLSIQPIPSSTKGVTLIPLREMANALGAQVSWNASTKTATVTDGTITLVFKANDSTVLVNGKPIKLSTPPAITKGRFHIPLRWFNETMGAKVNWDFKTSSISIITPITAKAKLPIVGSLDQLKSLLAHAEQPRNYYSRSGAFSETLTNAGTDQKASAPQAPASPSGGSIAGTGSYSSTNTQVQGVDEADIIKTDGKYIYQVNDQRILIAQAYPAEEMKIVSSLDFKQEEFAPLEIYVDKQYLIVIGSTIVYGEILPMDSGEVSSNSTGMAKPGIAITEPTIGAAEPTIAAERKMIAPYYPARTTVMAKIYDISNKEKIIKVREIELEGQYISSRKVGSSLYLISNKYIDYYRILSGTVATKDMPSKTSSEPSADIPSAAPVYRDSAGSDKLVTVDFEKIRYFPGPVEPNYLLIGALDLEQPTKEMQVSTYLGSGNSIYASQENLYVAVTQYEPISVNVDNPESLNKPLVRSDQTKTAIYKFILGKGEVTYSGKGEVPGTILNQFSMDEHAGHFRIATTSGDSWRSDQFTSQNNVYILDNTLQITGKIENMAPGERIYSVRFMGDRGYMVTFKTVDPLFVIDLKDTKAPKVLGALKIPGYSDYLHPYDENHIIGFGKSTTEISNKDEQGNVINTTALYLGMKIALFDVTDVTHPVEMFKEHIGDRGTDSELLRNHKALLFSEENHLLAFPVTLMEVGKTEGAVAGPGADGSVVSGGSSGSSTGSGGSSGSASGAGSSTDAVPVQTEFPEYGQFTYQGAYVYQLDLTKGFTLKGRITHLSAEDLLKASYNGYDYTKQVDRILYIQDTLYTTSKGFIKANDLNTLKEKGTLDLTNP